MNTQSHLKRLLKADLVAAQARNSAFSLRAFARRIGLQASALSEILNGKRLITRKMAVRILSGLAVPPDEAQRVLREFEARAQPLEFARIDMDQFHVVSDWYYFAILSLADTRTFKGDPTWVARRLGIRVQEARVALERFERLGMLVRSKEGSLGPTGKQFETSADVVNLSLRKQHAQNLELARRSLERDDLHEREFTFISMAGDPAKVAEIKRRIRAFRDELCADFESGAREEVYRMCIQLFPLTKKEFGELK